jgi:hypothetical protein
MGGDSFLSTQPRVCGLGIVLGQRKGRCGYFLRMQAQP